MASLSAKTREQIEMLVAKSQNLTEENKKKVLARLDVMDETQGLSILEALVREQVRMQSIDEEFEKEERQLGAEFMKILKETGAASVKEDLKVREAIEKEKEEEEELSSMDKIIDAINEEDK